MVSFFRQIRYTDERGWRDLMEITSVHNPKVKEWCRLHQKKHREQTGMFLIEGMHLIEEAQRVGLIDLLFVLQDQPHPAFDVPICTLSEPVMRKLTDSISGSDIAALCHMPLRTVSAPSRCIMLDHIQDPGNVGTILRTAHAFGFDDIILSPGCADLYNEKVIRSTQGALFHMNCVQEDLHAAIARLRAQGASIYATALHHDSLPLAQLKTPTRFALIFGNEGQGVEEALIAKSDASVYIEMAQFESLNVAVAAAICMYALSH